jgi:ATP-dependent Clp protease ATP-binding subunit ClpC
VGKTELGRALAEALFGSPDKLVRLDLSEYTDRSAVTRMIGAPPGHVGYEDAGQLTEAVRRDPYTVVLLDEIEKAHPRLPRSCCRCSTPAAHRRARPHGRLPHAIVIMTSNIGADRILAAEDLEDVREAVLTEARARLRPELVGRVDEVVLFARLSRPELRRIVACCSRRRANGSAPRASSWWWTTRPPISWPGWARGGSWGARPLRRTVGKEVERRLARMLLAGELAPGATARVTAEGGLLVVKGS